MKKLLSILLVLVMVFSLTVPALAAAPENDLDPPLWRIYGYDSYDEYVNTWSEEEYVEDLTYILGFMQSNPEQTAQFRASAYDYFEAEWTSYDSPEEFMERWDDTEEQFVTEMTVYQIIDARNAGLYAQEWAETCAAQPEKTAQFLAELPAWFAEEYFWYDSFEEYCAVRSCVEEAYVDLFAEWSYDPAQAWAETCAAQPERTAQFLAELTGWFAENYSWYDSLEDYRSTYGYSTMEEVYLDLFYEWNASYEWAQELAAYRAQYITDHGGVNGQVNVQLNDKCIPFPDAVPELVGGRTMVPVRAIMEYLGAEVDYRDGDIICAFPDRTLTFTVGETEVTVDYPAGEDGDEALGEIITMDCAPYIKGGRTYVPVRFFAQALGYQVGWDNDFRMVVLLDVDAVVEEIDKSFTILNDLLAKELAAQTGRQKATGSANATLTLFDSLNGDTTKEMTYSYDLTADTTGASGQYEYNLESLWDLYQDYVISPLEEAGGLTDETARQLELIKGLLSGTMQIRVDQEKGMYYIQSPVLNAILDEVGYEVAAGDWLSISMEDAVGQVGQTEQLTADLTMGRLITALSLNTYSVNSVHVYDNLLAASGLSAKLVGDSRFTRSGDTQTLTLTREDLVALSDDFGMTASDWDMISEFTLTANFHDNGDEDASFQCTMALDDGSVNLGDMVQVSLTTELRNGRGTTNAEIHIKNVLKFTVDANQTLTPTNTAPSVTPPEGATIHDITEMEAGSVTSPDGPTTLINPAV